MNPPDRSCVPLSLALAVAMMLANGAQAAPDTWVGGTSANWSGDNWTGGNNPPLDGDALFFGLAGTSGSILNNDLLAGLSFAGITFNPGANAFVLNGNAITLAGNVVNSSTSLQTINLDMALTAQRLFTTANGGGDLLLGGLISGTGGITKTGNGTLTLTNAANTYTGETIFGGGGIVNVASVSDYGVASSLGSRPVEQENNSLTGISLHFQGGTLQYTGSTPQSTNREIRILGGGTAPGVNNTIDASGSNPNATLSFTHTGTNINLFDTGGHRTLTLTGTNTGANTFSIRLTDQNASSGLTNLSKAGTGTWYVTNTDSTYTGETFFKGGILNVASLSDYGVPSSIGARTLANENTTVTGVGLHFQGGTLQYTGSTPQSTNRNIRVLNGNGATIDASGSNPDATLSFTHTGANMNLFDTPGTRTITLTGTNTGNNGFSILLLDQAGAATSLAKSGPGTWVLNGPDSNVNIGFTTVNNGTLVLAKTLAIAVSGGLSIGAGSSVAVVQMGGTGGNQIADTIVPSFVGSGATAGILRMANLTETVAGLNSGGGSGVVENESGTAGTGTLTVNVTGNFIFSGVLRDGDGAGVDGQLSLVKLGAGTQVLTGASTHTGATMVNAGTLTVDGSLGSSSTVTISNATLNGAGTIAGPVNVGSGGVYAGTGTASGVVSLGSGGTLTGAVQVTGSVNAGAGSHISPGSANTPGTITIGTLTLATGSFLDYEFGAANDLVVVSAAGGLTLNGGGFNLFNAGGVTPLTTNGTYTLLDYNSNFAGSLANITIANAQAGKFYSIADDTVNTVITLTVGDATVSEWNGAALDGLWSTSGNWVGVTPNAAGAVAKFGTIPSSHTTISINGAKVVGSIVFDNTNAYTINGAGADAITLSNGIAAAGITIITGSHTITAPLILATDAVATTPSGASLVLAGNISGGRSFTATGLGTTVLTGTNSYATTNVTGGTLQVGIGGTTGTLGSGDVNVAANGALVFDRSDDIAVPNNIVGAGGQVTQLGSGILSLSGANTFGTSGSGKLNLTAGTIRLASATAVPPNVFLAFGSGILDLNENNITVGALAGLGGTITDRSANSGTTTLVVTQSTSSSYAGSIADGLARTIAITKNGNGALTLAGNNAFTGPLGIANGAIIAAGVLGNIPISSSVNLGNGNNDVFLIAGAPDNQFGANSVINFTNAGKNAKFLLRGSNQTVAGLDSVGDPGISLAIIENDEPTAPGYTAAPGPAVLTINTISDHSFAGIIRTQTGTSLDLVKEGPGKQEIRNILTQASNFGQAIVNAGTLVFNLTPNANNTNTLGANTTVTVNPGATLGLDGSWVMSRSIFGGGDVVKLGLGGITMNGVNSYTGNTTIIGGTLTASAAGVSIPGNITLGTGAQSDVFLVTGAANQFGPNTVLTFNNGTGRNAKFELRGQPQTVAGLSSDADDTLSIVQNQETGNPATTTLTINTTGDYVFNGIIRTQVGGPLNLLKTGPGTQELRNVPVQGYNFGTATIDQGKLLFNLNTLPGGGTGHDMLGANISIVVNAGGTLGLDGTWNMTRSVSGTGDVLKQGAGTVTVSSVLTHTGNTIVGAGTLLVTGSLSGTAKIDVQSGATLGGNGFLGLLNTPTSNLNLLSGGKLSPGAPVGTLSTIFSGGRLDISQAVTGAGTQALLFDLDSIFLSDRVQLTGGPLTIGSGMLAFDDFVFTPLPGFGVGTYTLFDGDTSIDGTLDSNSANLAGSIGTLFGTIGFGDDGKDLVLTVVPEPGSITLLVGGIGVALGLRRRRLSPAKIVTVATIP